MSILKALVTAEVIPERLEESFKNQIQFEYDGYSINHDNLPHEELVKKIKDYDILICEYDTISKDVFDNAERLKIIICCRGGVKTVVDLSIAMQKGIIVCNNAGRNAGAVTDMTMGFILDLTRNITLTNNLIHSKQLTAENSTKPKEYQDTVWGLDNDSPFIKYRGRSINHMNLGIVGFGKAGRLLATKAHIFGMNILAYDPYTDFTDKPDYVTVCSWERLLQESDVISLHCILSPQTQNLFSAKEFYKMKKGSYFINTARGELIVEEDLIEALKNGHLSGAAIDVTQKEPIPNSSILINTPNLLITPHIAGSANDVQEVGTQMTIDALNDFLNGKKPKYAVVYK